MKQALACERFIISTDHKSGARELLGDDEYGILTPVDDKKAMEAAMRRALEDEDLRQDYEKKAYGRVAKFDKNAVAAQLIGYLEGENGE